MTLYYTRKTAKWVGFVPKVISIFPKFNPLTTNPTKWSNTLKQFVGNCLSVFDHFVGLALKGLRNKYLPENSNCF